MDDHERILTDAHARFKWEKAVEEWRECRAESEVSAEGECYSIK